jgi:hypothetical protein
LTPAGNHRRKNEILSEEIMEKIAAQESETFSIKTETNPTSAVLTTRTEIPKIGALRTLQLYFYGGVTIDGSNDGAMLGEGILSLVDDIRLLSAAKSGARNVGMLRKIDLAAQYNFMLMMESFAGVKSNPTPLTKSAANSPFSLAVDIDLEMPWADEKRLTLLKGSDFDGLTLEMDWQPLSNIMGTTVPSIGASGLNCLISGKRYTARSAIANAKGNFPFQLMNYQEKLLNGANTDFTFDMPKGSTLRGVFIKTFTRNAVTYHTPVDTIIQSASFKGDNQTLREYASIGQLKAENQRVYGVAPGTGYQFIDFMSGKGYETSIPANRYRDRVLHLNVANISYGVVRVYPVEIHP